MRRTTHRRERREGHLEALAQQYPDDAVALELFIHKDCLPGECSLAPRKAQK